VLLIRKPSTSHQNYLRQRDLLLKFQSKLQKEQQVMIIIDDENGWSLPDFRLAAARNASGLSTRSEASS
jgi:hypothetical protein